MAGAPNGMCSKPKNPGCAVCTDGCSEALLGDVCVWHSCRMGTLEQVKCGCKSNPCVDGDSPGRMMRREYEIKKAAARGETLTYSDFAVIDTVGHFHCCGQSQNGDTDIARCGDMRVCEDCAPKHTKLEYYEGHGSSDDDSYEEVPEHWLTKPKEPVSKVTEWIHRPAYSKAIVGRQAQNKKVMYANIHANGPECSLFKDGQLITVNSADGAFAEAKTAKTLEDMEWWTWFAGWCEDCPKNLRAY
jgi:hypothetical protein